MPDLRYDAGMALIEKHRATEMGILQINHYTIGILQMKQTVFSSRIQIEYGPCFIRSSPDPDTPYLTGTGGFLAKEYKKKDEQNF